MSCSGCGYVYVLVCVWLCVLVRQSAKTKAPDNQTDQGSSTFPSGGVGWSGKKIEGERGVTPGK